MSDAYEARVLTANLPLRTITFVYQDRGPPLAGGIFRIERVRMVTKADEKAFALPPAEICPHCGRKEEW